MYGTTDFVLVFDNVFRGILKMSKMDGWLRLRAGGKIMASVIVAVVGSMVHFHYKFV